MGYKMNRGKQQALFNYLPGKTFDFERIATIAIVKRIQGENVHKELNVSILLKKISEEIKTWHPDFRPLLRDSILQDQSRFVLLNPLHIESEIYPKVFWCQNKKCGRVFDYTNNDDTVPKAVCPICNEGKVVQLRFVKTHQCGAIQPLKPPICNKCHSAKDIALDSRGSERISNFRWICRRCNSIQKLSGGWCTECQWPLDEQNSDIRVRQMNIEVHRSGRTYYPQVSSFLNIPNINLDSLFILPEWSAIIASKFLGFPEMKNKKLIDFAQSKYTNQKDNSSTISRIDFETLMGRYDSGEITSEQLVLEMKALHNKDDKTDITLNRIVHVLEEKTGVDSQVWEEAGYELLESVIPLDNISLSSLSSQLTKENCSIVSSLGIQNVTLIEDFPIVNATYGFSRVEYKPNKCRLNAFPQMREHGGRIPIFVDQVQADALLFKLDIDRIYKWLEANNMVQVIPTGTEVNLSRQAYFVELFSNLNMRETIKNTSPQARMVFGLIHTLSHLCIRQAALLCGLDRTSLSEYIMPRALMFAIYCNHRFGATIGALTTLYESSVNEWLNSVYNIRHCVYDPVCKEREGSCHACTYLAETSCKYYNLNLGRAFLFGGNDVEIGNIPIGYFDPAL